MELLTIRNEGPAAPSATVVLLRDAGHDIEVFLLQRHAQSFVLGGAYVFPGGSLDAADCGEPLLAASVGVSPARAGEQLELAPERALGHWGCAIRETFEEAGVLLAYDLDGIVDGDHADHGDVGPVIEIGIAEIVDLAL